MVLPSAAVPPGPGRWWRCAAEFGALGGLVGLAVVGVVLAGPGWVAVALAVGAAALLVNAWGLSGGQP